MKVTASDPDIGDVLTYRMAFEDPDEFHIDKSSGALILKSALDYETKQSHEIIVEVTDDLHVATATVIVTISDVNDNAPVFQSASYRYVFKHFIWATMRENLSPGVPEQHRCRPACSFGQSDQRLCCSLFGKYQLLTCYR